MGPPTITSRPSGSIHLGAAVLAATLVACSDGTGPGDDDRFTFGAPIVGVPMADVFYGAYLDHDPTPGAMDYHCGAKAYAGHRGVDILLRNFQVQDSGVAVLAAAPGIVRSTADGEPDRNTQLDPLRGFGNRVVLLHEDGKETIYAHLRRGSIGVDEGQSVEAGAVLGLVGSSGNSNWPHLHFEVRRDGSVLDPFAGDCGPSESLWTAQLPYQNQFKVTDAGIIDAETATLDELLERPPTLDELPLNAGSFVFWAQFANQRAGLVRIEVHGPSGQRPHTVSGFTFATFSMRYLSTSIPVVDTLTEAGDWRIETYQDDALIWTQPFRLVVPPVADRAAPAPPRRAPDRRTFRIDFLDQARAGRTFRPR